MCADRAGHAQWKVCPITGYHSAGSADTSRRSGSSPTILEAVARPYRRRYQIRRGVRRGPTSTATASSISSPEPGGLRTWATERSSLTQLSRTSIPHALRSRHQRRRPSGCHPWRGGPRLQRTTSPRARRWCVRESRRDREALGTPRSGHCALRPLDCRPPTSTATASRKSFAASTIRSGPIAHSAAFSFTRRTIRPGWPGSATQSDGRFRFTTAPR